ncbi:hypothetical protein, partial [Bartonella sp. CL32QHWL-2]|uniref:hypothetical protein n=1 Tax=Bartonella sp. CL32QHWL-2 TaxID=3243525 RepID=UPI0035CFBC84
RSLLLEKEDKLAEELKLAGRKYDPNKLSNLAPRIYLHNNKPYFWPKNEELANFTDQQKKNINVVKDHFNEQKNAIIRLIKSDGTFYSESTLKNKYGTDFARMIKRMIAPDEPAPMEGPRIAPMEGPTPVSQIQSIAPETQAVIDTVTSSNKPIDKLIDSNDDELKSLGFTESALRELRGLKQAGDDLAAVKREKDMQIQELEDQLNNLTRDYVKSVEEDAKDTGELKKQIDKLNDKLYEEMSKVWRLDNDRESQTRKIKRLIVDVLKKPDSTIPLKDRIKLLFKTYGVTISAIITAVVMTLTTLGLSISSALSGATKSVKPSPGPGPS